LFPGNKIVNDERDEPGGIRRSQFLDVIYEFWRRCEQRSDRPCPQFSQGTNMTLFNECQPPPALASSDLFMAPFFPPFFLSLFVWLFLSF
jgi:hypothetical protein